MGKRLMGFYPVACQTCGGPATFFSFWLSVYCSTCQARAEFIRVMGVKSVTCAWWCGGRYEEMPLTTLWWARTTDGLEGFRVTGFCTKECCERGRALLPKRLQLDPVAASGDPARDIAP